MNNELPANENLESHSQLQQDEKRVLERLGAAVLIRWNDLPTELQRSFFDIAASDMDPERESQLKQDIARFLHTHKNNTQDF
jgi:hypothetical protein